MSQAGTTSPPFSLAELGAWGVICRKEVEYVLQQPDSWYYEFPRKVAEPAPDGLKYELQLQQQDPPFSAYATSGSTMHALMTGTIEAPLPALAHPIVGVESDHQWRSLLTHMYGDLFIDGGILQVAERATPDDPFHLVSVAHMTVKMPLLAPREFVIFDVAGSLKDINGELVVFKVACSVPSEAANIGELAASHTGSGDRYVQGEIHMTFLLRGIDQGARTDLKVQSRVRMATKAPSCISSKLQRPMWNGIGRLGTLDVSHALREKLTEVLRQPPRQRITDDSESPKMAPGCRVCMRRRRFTPTRVCVGCDRRVCKSCTERLHFATECQPHKTVAFRFCLDCVQEARNASSYVSIEATGSSSSGNEIDLSVDVDQ